MIVPGDLRNGRNGGEGWRPRVRREGGEQRVELDGREVRSMTREVVDVRTILACQARLGIDRVLLSPWVPLLYPEVEPAACLERCRIQNQALAGIVTAVPDSDLGARSGAASGPRARRRRARRVAAGALAGVEVSASVEATM